MAEKIEIDKWFFMINLSSDQSYQLDGLVISHGEFEDNMYLFELLILTYKLSNKCFFYENEFYYNN